MRLKMLRPPHRGVRNVALASSVAALTVACSQSEYPPRSINGASVNRPAFTEDEYGVRSSRRVLASGPIPKGGGRFKIGNPYKVAGRWYVPREDPRYDRSGVSSWYGDDFHGRRTANGEIFDRRALSAAHPTLPLPSYAYVTNLENGRTILVRVNDRGPYVNDRIIDLSHASASALGFVAKGRARVRVQYAGRAPLNGDDRRERRFLADQRNIWNGTAVAGYRPPSAPLPYRAAMQRPDREADRWSPTAYRAALAGKPAPGDLKPEITDRLAGRRAYEPTGSIPPPRPYGLAGPSEQAPAPGLTDGRRAFVQVGYFRDAENAESLRREFGHLGPVEVAPLRGPDGAIYRVRLGPLSTGEAEQAFQAVSARGVTGGTIVFE